MMLIWGTHNAAAELHTALTLCGLHVMFLSKALYLLISTQGKMGTVLGWEGNRLIVQRPATHLQ